MSEILSAGFETFVVRPLADLSKVELQEGQMLARRIQKGEGGESLGVVLEAPTQEEFVLALENESILRGAYNWYLGQVEEAAKARINSGAKSICRADFSPEAIAAQLDAEEISQGRVSKAKLEAWFNSTVQPVLHATLRAKYPEIENSVMLSALGQYKAAVGNLAKREFSFSPEVYGKLEAMFKIISEESPMLAWCKQKLPACAPKTVDMLGL